MTAIQVGTALRRAREQAGLTQVQMAALMRCDQRSVSAYECGRVTVPGTRLSAVLRTLGVGAEAWREMLGGVEQGGAA